MPSPRFRGSNKTPGGKLVNVDFAVDSGKLRDVVVHGDFFLYPESALEAIRDSLEGIAIDTPVVRVTERVRKALPVGTEWLGSSPEGLAQAVQRAIDVYRQGGKGSSEVSDLE